MAGGFGKFERGRGRKWLIRRLRCSERRLQSTVAMNLLRMFAVLTACLTAAACGGAQCLALCVSSAELTLVDGSGAAVTPGSGSITIGSATEAFDCTKGSNGQQPDGGTLSRVACAGNKLKIEMQDGEATQVTLSVTQAGGGKAFSGSVALSYTESGQEVCGTKCRVAAHNVTLQ